MTKRDSLRRRVEELERARMASGPAFLRLLKAHLRDGSLPTDPVVARSLQSMAADIRELQARGEGYPGWADYSKSGDPE